MKDHERACGQRVQPVGRTQRVAERPGGPQRESDDEQRVTRVASCAVRSPRSC